MTYSEYWNEDPHIAIAYRRAKEEKMRDENFMMWRLGMYMTHAVSIALGKAFSKEGASTPNYTSEPFPLFPKDAEQKKANDEKRRMQEMVARMEAKTKIHKQIFQKGEMTEDGRSNDKQT